MYVVEISKEHFLLIKTPPEIRYIRLKSTKIGPKLLFLSLDTELIVNHFALISIANNYKGYDFT